MKGSEKKVSFSPPPIIKSSASSPKVSDENDWSNHQKKHTVCAASKVGFPRKRILGERNESPGSNYYTNTHLSKSPNLVSKTSPKIVSRDSDKDSPKLNPKVTSKDPSSQETPLSYNSKDGTPSLSPYDPLTNYLSPRPQFLRYNPNRRKEIFLRLEMEGNDRNDEADTVSNETSSLVSSSSCEVEESGDESESLLEQEDEEFDSESEEEEEEEVRWSLRGALKYFILSVVLVLNISYIFSVNGPVSGPAFESSSPTLGFRNLSFGMGESFDVGYKFLDGKPEEFGLLSIDEHMTENANIGHIVSSEMEDGIVEDEFEEASEEFAENMELQDVEETEELIEDAMEENGETQDVIEDELVDDVEQLGQQAADDTEFVQVDHQASLLSEGTESSLEIREDPKDAGEDIHQETRENELVQSRIIQLKNAVSMVERWGKSIALNFQGLNQLKGLNQDRGTGVAIVVFGFLSCAAIVASFVFGSNIRRKGIASKQSYPADNKHSTKPVAKEKPSLPLPVERDETKRLDIPNTVPLITTSTVVPVGSRAPSVELLAEFDVGGISRWAKSSAVSRMNDEVSSRSNSYFSEQGFSQLSALNSSNSSEKSIAKKKKSGKELGSNDLKGEGKNNEVMTPLRRSTRIRNRVDVVSP